MTIPIPIRRITNVLDERFAEHIDLSDVAKQSEQAQRNSFLSRAFAALAVQDLTGFDAEQAAATVIDGFDDQGIDAVAVDEENEHLWLVQAKWSDQGKGGIGEPAANALLQGLKLIMNNDLAAFNDRFQALADGVGSVVRSHTGKITLVFAVAGDSALSKSVQRIMDNECDELNGGKQRIVDHTMLNADHFHRVVQRSVSGGDVHIDVAMEQAAHLENPYQAWYGTVPAEMIANWYEQHRDALFEDNIRHSLGVTKINRGLVDTLLSAPENFWYFNNGITVLCSSMTRSPRFAGKRNGPVDLRASHASVVNGAQTVTSMHQAMQEAPDIAVEATVLVRLISLEHCPEGFSAEITRATNTQNRVVEQDFVALRDEQNRLEMEFVLDLSKRYVVKRGASQPNEEDGCSVLEAATSLACGHADLRLAMRAKQDADLLWEPQTYAALFPDNIRAPRVWNTVRAHRAVVKALVEGGNRREGRAELVASHGDALIAHIVVRLLNSHGINDVQGHFENELGRVRDLVRDVVPLLVFHVDRVTRGQPKIAASFKDLDVCESLAKSVLSDMRSGQQVPAMPEEYLPQARKTGRRGANAVSVIIDSQVIDDGTPLFFEPVTGPERRNVAAWIAEDPARGKATWVNHRSKPLLWSADGTQYSPSGLVIHMLGQAPGKTVKAVQGTTRWRVPNQGTLKEISDKAKSERAE